LLIPTIANIDGSFDSNDSQTEVTAAPENTLPPLDATSPLIVTVPATQSRSETTSLPDTTTTSIDQFGINTRASAQPESTTTITQPTTTVPAPEVITIPVEPETSPPTEVPTLPAETVPAETLPPETLPPETEAPSREPPVGTGSNLCSDKFDDYKSVTVVATPWATLQKIGLKDPEISFLVEQTDFLKRSGLKDAQSGDSITLPTAANIRCSYPEL
jgi:hypothetical protein